MLNKLQSSHTQKGSSDASFGIISTLQIRTQVQRSYMREAVSCHGHGHEQ